MRARGITILAAAHCRDVESPRVRRSSNTPAQKLGSSAVFPSFMGMSAGSQSDSGSVGGFPGVDTHAGSFAAVHASFERPMTAAAPSSMTAGSSLGTAALLARPSTAAPQSESQSDGL